MFETPDEFDMLSFFASEPVERTDEGLAMYAVQDGRGFVLRFSYHCLERSVQTNIEIGGSVVAQVLHEQATKMYLEGDVLKCEFDGPKNTRLSIRLRDGIEVRWSTLAPADSP